MQSQFKITQEQKEKLKPFLPNIDELLQGPLRNFLRELDDAIIGELGENYDDTDTSVMLQKIFDEIYDQND